jgi:hypothetical protein
MDELKPLALLQPWEISRLTTKWQEVRGATNAELGALLGHVSALDLALQALLCEGCPPIGYPTDETRCSACPRRTSDAEAKP